MYHKTTVLMNALLSSMALSNTGFFVEIAINDVGCITNQHHAACVHYARTRSFVFQKKFTTHKFCTMGHAVVPSVCWVD